jgi:hypothetical protein
VYFDGVFVETAGGLLGPTGPTGSQSTIAVSTTWWLGV